MVCHEREYAQHHHGNAGQPVQKGNEMLLHRVKLNVDEAKV